MSYSRTSENPEETRPVIEDKTKEWTLRELAAATGVPVRTIRFYISRGLVDPPLRGGRGAAYGEAHRARLRTIREMQAKGMMLAEIAHSLAAAPSGPPIGAPELAAPGRTLAEREPGLREMIWFEKDGGLDESQRDLMRPSLLEEELAALPFPEPETWRSYAVAPDVQIWFRVGAGPWRVKALLAALRRFADDVGRIAPKEKR
jgi:DNA-binding transcriptional MerR regulator